jgi:hypothetical protein
MAALEFAMVVNGDYDFLVTRIERSAPRRLIVAKVPELETNCSIHDEDASGTQEEWGGAEDPAFAVAAIRADPAGALAGSVVVPCAGVGEEGC